MSQADGAGSFGKSLADEANGMGGREEAQTGERGCSGEGGTGAGEEETAEEDDDDELQAFALSPRNVLLLSDIAACTSALGVAPFFNSAAELLALPPPATLPHSRSLPPETVIRSSALMRRQEGSCGRLSFSLGTKRTVRLLRFSFSLGMERTVRLLRQRRPVTDV